MNLKKYNYGLSLLKLLMCFEVILCHFWVSETIPVYLKLFYYLKPYAVPVFMFISFYLTGKTFNITDKKRIVGRIYKLLLPQIIWSIIYYAVYFIVGIIKKEKTIDGFSDFLWQLFTGHCPRLNPTMWFQIDLIVISLLFFATFYVLKDKKAIGFIVVLSVLCLLLQYSGLNGKICGAFRYELRWPLGRLIETIPVATLGLISYKYNLFEKTKNNRILYNTILIVLLTIILVILDNYFFVVQASFGYSGIWKVGIAFMFSFLFYNFRISSEICIKVIRYLSKYTLGIYCGHRLVHFIIINFLGEIVVLDSFMICIIVFIISFVLSWLISLIPFKWIKKIV